MRDLTSRLRAIVRRETATPGAPAGPREPATGHRELTYVPDVSAGDLRADAAARLGGMRVDEGGGCVMIEQRYAADRSHGRRRIEACVPAAGAPLHLFDARAAEVPEWWRRVVFFDIETTGLSGGAGTVAFLAGCGWFDDDGFVVRQYFLAGPSGERPMLDALGRVFDDASLLVTYNGRTFDLPFMETRWAYHRSAPPTEDLPHFDMLPIARRLWSRRASARPGEDEGCSLTALERRILDFHRHGDVPGFEIPARYFHFLRSGDPGSVGAVLEHNRLDIVSLAAVMSHALWLVESGPLACREAGERVALGRLYERAGMIGEALEAYASAADSACDRHTAGEALERRAILLRRQRRYVEAAEAWQRILDLAPPGRRALSGLEQRAVEALAIHHEHRARDLESARQFAGVLERTASGTLRAAVDRRLARLERKLAQREARSSRTLGYDEEP